MLDFNRVSSVIFKDADFISIAAYMEICGW
jgi:hypothetical protein